VVKILKCCLVSGENKAKLFQEIYKEYTSPIGFGDALQPNQFSNG
jgi:hypothetical protein